MKQSQGKPAGPVASEMPRRELRLADAIALIAGCACGGAGLYGITASFLFGIGAEYVAATARSTVAIGSKIYPLLEFVVEGKKFSVPPRGAFGTLTSNVETQALQQLGKVSAMPVEEGLKTEAQDLITQIYSVWYPHLDRRNIELQGEVNKARTTLEDARRELASAQQSVKIDAGFNKDGSSTTKFGQSTAKAPAAQRLAQAKAKFDSAQTALCKLENEQKLVTTYHTFARANADRLKVRDVIAKVEQAKNPTVAPSPNSGSQPRLINIADDWRLKAAAACSRT